VTNEHKAEDPPGPYKANVGIGRNKKRTNTKKTTPFILNHNRPKKKFRKKKTPEPKIAKNITQ